MTDQKAQEAAYPAQPVGPGYPPQGENPAYPPQQGGPPPAYPGPPQQPYPGQQQPYPPQAQGGAPPVVVQQQPAVTTTVVTTQVVSLGDRAANTQCPNCHNQVTSNTTREMGGLVWLIAAVLCIFGLWPCCLIPFCITDLYDVKHTCPVCNYHLGFHRKL